MPQAKPALSFGGDSTVAMYVRRSVEKERMVLVAFSRHRRQRAISAGYEQHETEFRPGLTRGIRVPHTISHVHAMFDLPTTRMHPVHLSGVYELKITVGQHYPMVPPSMMFVTKIFHPNIHFSVSRALV